MYICSGFWFENVCKIFSKRKKSTKIIAVCLFEAIQDLGCGGGGGGGGGLVWSIRTRRDDDPG